MLDVHVNVEPRYPIYMVSICWFKDHLKVEEKFTDTDQYMYKCIEETLRIKVSPESVMRSQYGFHYVHVYLYRFQAKPIM